MGEVKRCPWPFVHLLGGSDERDVRDCRESVGDERAETQAQFYHRRDATPNLILSPFPAFI